VRSTAVDQIVHLPGLTALPEAQESMAGVFDLRGVTVPVLDLSTLVNRPLNRYFLTDSVIVLHGNGHPMGIIASQVIDVCSISRSGEESVLPGFCGKFGRNLIDGIARVENEIVLLLNTEKLLRHGTAIDDDRIADKGAGELRTNGRPFHQKIAPEEEEAFRARARRLIPQLGDEDRAGFLELAVVCLSGEYFGLPLEYIREFCEIRTITPVPCCPPHIIGTMNLRGEILTVIDLCPVLKMPASKLRRKKVVVLECDGSIAGVGIDDICELVYADRASIAPHTLTADASACEYLRGTVVYGNNVMSILDAAKLLRSEELVVNDEI
jgi:purine-binding chemotaxis protein CheW